MPIHDWSIVDADLFHDFRQSWSVRICDALNAGRLPKGFSALLEPYGGSIDPHARTAHDWSRSSDTSVRTAPNTRYVIHAKTLQTQRANRIAIRYRLAAEVCVIDIVSPGNKTPRAAMQEFVEKAIAGFRQGVNLLVIDLLAPTPRDPCGIHNAIWDEIDEESFELDPAKPLTLAAYVAGVFVAGTETTAYVEPVGVGDALPDMPVFLDAHNYVLVPLEETYQAAWASCSADFRELVETGRLPGE